MKSRQLSNDPLADVGAARHYIRMTQDNIAEVGIDHEQRLFVRPTSKALPFVWRAAMGVGWDEKEKRLFSPKPKEWNHVDCFAQIIWAAADEYGIWLRLTPHTVWLGVSDELRAEIQLTPIPPKANTQS